MVNPKDFAEKMAKEQEEALKQKRLDTKVKLLKTGFGAVINKGVLAGVEGDVLETNPQTTILRTSDGSEIMTRTLDIDQPYVIKELNLGANDIVVGIENGSTDIKFVESADKDSVLLVGGKSGDELFVRSLNSPFDEGALADGDFKGLASRYRLLCKAEDRQDAETFVHIPRKHLVVSYEV